MKRISSRVLDVIDSILGTDYCVKFKNRHADFHNPEYRFENHEIAFIHIPKSGGTSFHVLLSRDEESRFVNLNMHRPVSRLCKPGEFRYITIIRDPVERVWSYYQMVLGKPAGYPYRRFADKGLECFLKNCWEVQDMACRYYSGCMKPKPNATTLDTALNNLKNFICVIEFDNFHKEVAAFLEQFNMPTESIPHERRRHYAPPEPSDRSLICEYNEFDVKLYSQWLKYPNSIS